jgi:hypothetical protein
VLAPRAVYALPIIAAGALWRMATAALRRSPRHALPGAVVADSVCYYAGATADFFALATLDISVKRALSCSYPSIVVLLRALM